MQMRAWEALDETGRVADIAARTVFYSRLDEARLEIAVRGHI